MNKSALEVVCSILKKMKTGWIRKTNDVSTLDSRELNTEVFLVTRDGEEETTEVNENTEMLLDECRKL
jgi:hypothetical protein